VRAVLEAASQPLACLAGGARHTCHLLCSEVASVDAWLPCGARHIRRRAKDVLEFFSAVLPSGRAAGFLAA